MTALTEASGADVKSAADGPTSGVGGDDPRKGRVAVIAVAGVLLALTALLVQIRLSLPADGTITSAYSSRPDGVRITALVDHGGLRTGDVVVAVNGRSLGSRTLPTARVGERLIYTVERDGTVIDTVVPVRRSYPSPPPWAATGRRSCWSCPPSSWPSTCSPDDPTTPRPRPC